MYKTLLLLLAAATITALGGTDGARAQANGDPGAVQSGTAKATDQKAKKTEDAQKREASHPSDRTQGVRDRH